MYPPRFFRAGRTLALLAFLSAVSCHDAATPVTPPPVPVLTTLLVTLPSSPITMGQTATATAAGVDQNGAAIAAGTITWSTASAAVATVSAAGVVTGVSAGTTQVIATVGSKTGQQALTVTAPPALRINEVESNGGTPGDWAEIYNPTSAPVDLSGWVFRDNDSTHAYRFPAGTTIPAGGYVVAEEASFGFGLGAPDDTRLYNPFGVLVDVYTWTTHAAITYGRCPDGTGTFASTSVSTKGAANVCGAVPSGPTVAAWPGSDDVHTVDGTAVFGGNLSGLTYEAASAGRPAVLWAVRNGPGTLYRLVFSGGIWTPDPANGWGAGKALHYTDDLGNTDSEGVTFAAGGSAGGIYVATERNNDANTISRNSVLRFDAAQPGATLRATNEWKLTSDLPAVGANLGIEAVTWIADSVLVAKQFFDETAKHTYAPAEYPDHGTGLFFVGLEANGTLYAYALNHVTNGVVRVATVASGHPAVMGLEYDRDSGYLWAACDDGCEGRVSVLEIDTVAGSATRGRFTSPRLFARPTSMPNLNNEGFAFAPDAECVGGRKPVFWADDGETGGHSVRAASLSCGRIAPSVQAAPVLRATRGMPR